jgi:hypothetical protein
MALNDVHLNSIKNLKRETDLEVKPSKELKFECKFVFFKFKKKIIIIIFFTRRFKAINSTVHLILRNPTNDKCIYYKFKTTKPKMYIVRPAKGYLMPRKEIDVESLYFFF